VRSLLDGGVRLTSPKGIIEPNSAFMLAARRVRPGDYFVIKTFTADAELLEINYNVEGRPLQQPVGMAEFTWERRSNVLIARVTHDTTFPFLLLTAPPGYQTMRDTLQITTGTLSSVWYGAESVLVTLSRAGPGEWTASFGIPADEPLANWWLLTVCSAKCYTPARRGNTRYVFFFQGLTDEDFNPTSGASALCFFAVLSSYFFRA